MISSQGSKKTVSQTSYFNKAGGGGNTMWYLGAQNQTAIGTHVVGANTFYATPFVLTRSLMLSKISFELTTSGGAGSKTRVGIYRSTSLRVLYPSSLVVDSGEFDTTVAPAVLTTSGLSVNMGPGLYWHVILAGTSNPTLRGKAANSDNHILGAPNTLATLYTYLSVALAYQALPTTFPAGGVLNSATIASVAMEFA